MANATVKLYVTGYGYTSKSEPTTVFDISSQDHVSLTSDNNYNEQNRLYIKFDAFPSNLKRNRLYYASAMFRLKGFNNNAIVNLKPANSEFNPSTLTWETQPDVISEKYLSTTYRIYSDSDYEYDFMPSSYTVAQKSQLAAEFLKNNTAFLFSIYRYADAYYKKLSDGTTAPYIEILYDDSTYIQSKIEVTSGATSGYVNPRTATRFSWRYVPNDSTGYVCADSSFGQTSAIFYWKKSTDENYTAINISGNTQEITVAANTFPTGSTINWYISGPDDGNTTSQTSVYSFSTAAGTVTTTPISPKNSIVSNNSEITFTWTYSSTDGYAPSRQVFMWKRITDDSWTTLAEFNDARTTYTAPAYTFPSGELYWGVVPYNIDDVAGTGNSAKIISYGAPDTPVVYATGTPFMTITWQSDDQQSYEIRIGDRQYGPYFGEEKSFNVPDYFEDGNYLVEVRVVGAYGLWSEWGGSLVTIENEPSENVVLSGNSGVDCALSWETEEATADFLVYRDGVQIAHTENTYFLDRFALGEHVYYVVNRLTDGNYSKSNDVTLTATIEYTCIAALSGGNWVEIQYTLKNQSDISIEQTQDSFYNHLASSVFPSAVLSRYQEMNLSYSAVFLYNQSEDHQKFAALFGQPVILKLKDGSIFVGVFDTVAKVVKKHYYTSYSFTMRRIEWEDYIDDTGDSV